MLATARLGGGRRRLAVVGTGISGLVAARLLSNAHDVTVFEADGRIGGHTHTVDVEVAGRGYAIDTGFIVYNERNYPGFTRLLRALGVATRPTAMSFSLRCERTGLEYCGSSLSQIFAQRRNLFRPSFWGMLRDILRFHREGLQVLVAAGDPSVAELLLRGGYGETFADHYLLPMAASIWSTEPRALLPMPARFLLQFLHNHGMLLVDGRPTWRTVSGGSRSYLEPLVRPFLDRIRIGARVQRLARTDEGVLVSTHGAAPESFDGVVLAVHSDQALALLADPLPDEQAVLSAIRYQANDVVLHTDERLLPRRRRAWAAWNYRVPRTPRTAVNVTYCMNLLQGLVDAPTFCVTLNGGADIAPERVLKRFVYHHPLFDQAAVRAQRQLPGLQGVRRTWYCGAWCGYGFHEDGVASALRIAADFGRSLDDLGTVPREVMP